jgi:hypothetical protein
MSNNFKSIGTIYREMNMKKEAGGLDDVSALQALEKRMRTVEDQMEEQAAPDNGAGAGEYGSDKAKKQYQKDTPGQGGNIETDPTHTSTLPLAVDGIPKKGGEMVKPDMDKNAGIKTDPVKVPEEVEHVEESEFVANLDPVGQGDGDIDNDGDKDKSDKYLKKRRKAISKAIGKGKNESVEEGKYSPYISIPKSDPKKAAQTKKEIETRTGHARNFVKPKPGGGSFTDKNGVKTMSKGFGESRKFVAPGFMEDFSVTLKPHPTEKNKYLVHSVGKKLAAHGGMKPGETVHDSHIDDMHDSGIKVNHYKEEVVQELSAKTLGSYINKASSPIVKNSAINLASKGATKLAKAPDHDYEAGEKEDSKAFTRGKSIGIAAKKLVKKVSEMKEEVESVTELSRDTLASYQKKASDARGHRNLPTAKVDNRYKGVSQASKKLAAKESVESVDEAGRWDNSSSGRRYRSMSPEEKRRIAQKNRVMANAKAVYSRHESVEEAAMSPAERKVAAGKIFQMHQAKARNNQRAKSDAMKAAKSYKTSDDSHLDAKPAAEKPTGKRGHSETPHIVGQLRGVVDTQGNHKGVQFKDGSTKKVSADHAKKWLAKHDAAKPHQKLAMYKSHDNHAAFKSSLDENYFTQFFIELKIATMNRYKTAAKADNQSGENARHKGYPEKDIDARQAKRDSGIKTANKRIAKKQVKMATGIPFDKRYKGSNYSGAARAIEKIKPGLSNHPRVAAALKSANESVKFAKSLFAVEAIERRADRKTIIATDPATGRKVVKIAPKKEIDIGKGKMR